MTLSQRWLLLRRKLAFLSTPVEKRVRLDLETDGRQITYLLASLHALGYAVHLTGGSIGYRQLLELRSAVPIPFIIGGKSRPCGTAVSDQREGLGKADEPRKLLLNYDFFNLELSFPRMPYFMHPAVYQNGLDRLPVPEVRNARKIRIGFFGTRDAKFYTRRFHFEMLDRERILDSFLASYADRIWNVDGPVGGWSKREIAVAVDDVGGDREVKSFLPLPEYLQALRDCDFFLSPPGWCMPLSHNLIEGMAAGCIPILNCPEFLEPSLIQGLNCLAFESPQGLVEAIDRALTMAPVEVESMRSAVIAYHQAHLRAGVWLGEALAGAEPMAEVLVNAEEVSMEIRMPGGDFTPEGVLRK